MERALWVTRKNGEIIGMVDDLGSRNPASERFRATTMDGLICFFPNLEEAEQFVLAFVS
tara:strand:- start:649 stop:825 length:177 start_codon:yes stop_codon:yes gene_type:complete